VATTLVYAALRVHTVATTAPHGESPGDHSNDHSPGACPDTAQRPDRKLAVTLSHGSTGQCWDNALGISAARAWPQDLLDRVDHGVWRRSSLFAPAKGELVDLQT